MLSATIVHGHEGNAAVVVLQNTAAQALRAVPIAITVKDAHGRDALQNNAAGLEPALTSLGLAGRARPGDWIDDQILASGTPASVSATSAKATAAIGRPAALTVTGSLETERQRGAMAERSPYPAAAPARTRRRRPRGRAPARRFVSGLPAGLRRPPPEVLGGSARVSQHDQLFLIGDRAPARAALRRSADGSAHARAGGAA